jgi:hypothetical protein
VQGRVPSFSKPLEAAVLAHGGLFVYWLLVQRPVKTGQQSGDTSNARCAGREKVSAFRSVKRNDSLGAQVPVRG